MKAHYLQHVSFENLGYIQQYLEEKNIVISSTKLYENEILPNIDDFDILFIMGGPMGIYDEAIFPWLKEEKKFIKNAIKHNKKVIGVCLGAQLIADVLGAKVYKNKFKNKEEKEIGWFNVSQSNVSSFVAKLTNKLPKTFTAFHWHGDTFELPENAIRIFENDVCQNQAFLYKNNVLALQFHLEVTMNSIDNLTYYCQDEIINSKKFDFIQSEKEIKQLATKNIPILNEQMKLLLNNFFDF